MKLSQLIAESADGTADELDEVILLGGDRFIQLGFPGIVETFRQLSLHSRQMARVINLLAQHGDRDATPAEIAEARSGDKG